MATGTMITRKTSVMNRMSCTGGGGCDVSGVTRRGRLKYTIGEMKTEHEVGTEHRWKRSFKRCCLCVWKRKERGANVLEALRDVRHAVDGLGNREPSMRADVVILPEKLVVDREGFLERERGTILAGIFILLSVSHWAASHSADLLHPLVLTWGDQPMRHLL